MFDKINAPIFDAAANANELNPRDSVNVYQPEPPDSGGKQSILSAIQARRDQTRQRNSNRYARLNALGVSSDDFLTAVERSRRSGASAIQELICANLITADEYYRKLAHDLNLSFAPHINALTILSDMGANLVEHGGIHQLFGRGSNGLTLLYIAPEFGAESAIVTLLERDPEQRNRIRICTPETIVSALEASKTKSSLEWATDALHQRFPDLSAKHVFAPWQAYVLGVACVALPLCLYLNFFMTSFVIHIGSTLLFAIVILIRLAALRSLKRRTIPSHVTSVSNYPKYSVLVALHKEAAVASQLVRAMSNLDWPNARLEVLYVCEADDKETIEALLSHGLPYHHRIIKVPPKAPQTKPKALNFALKACSGEFIVIYDAEDRPHPLQLKEAWAKFSIGDENLACLQAPLVVTNAAMSWFARMFAFEYAAHFKGLLPYLAETGVPLPLGGTSNHFRKSAINEVGGWDPYNVTEDADLGIRFSRFGYKCGVLNLPTLEDGPENFKEWYPQRTRWQKGWMQTFLVHNRNQAQLFDMLGAKNSYYFEVLIAGFILSPLLYPISILMATYSIFSLDPGHLTLAAVDLTLLFLGYVCAMVLGLTCTNTWSSQSKFLVAATLPFYWLLLSVAAWRAIYQLIVKPHHWEKTPHRPVVDAQALSASCAANTTAPQVLRPAQ